MLGVDRWSRDHHAATLTLLQLAVVALMSLAVGWIDGAVWPDAFSAELMLCLGLTALLSTAFAFWVQTRFQQATTPTRAAMIFNLEPVFSALLAFSFLGERQGPHVLIACALIVAGMCAAEMRFTRVRAGSG
ncbi:DMT family transporter [Rhizobacter sp. LjRoot28]